MNATHPEVMASRKTADGAVVEFWTDGAIGLATDRFHSKIFARSVPRTLAWIMAGDLCLFTASELRLYLKAARRAWNLHRSEPHRTLISDVRRIMLAYAPHGES